MTLIAAGSALARAAFAAGTVATWPGNSPAASASIADAASLAGSPNQIRWGLGYIRSVYGSPCAAWSHEQAYGWY